MDKTKSTTPAGIDLRHSKGCGSRVQGRRCDCKPTFQASVYDARHDRKVRRTFPTISAAKSWRRDALAAVARNELQASPASTPRVADALDALLADMRSGVALTRSGTRYRPATCRTYAAHVRDIWKPAIGHLRLAEVRRADVQRVIDRLRAEGRAASSIHNVLDSVRVVFRRAVRDEIVRHSPLVHLELPAVRRKAIDVSTVEDPQALLDALPEADRALWATAFYAGLRRGELRALRWRNVDLQANRIRVEAGWDDVEGEQDVKTEAGERVVPIVAPLRAELVRHRLATGRSGDALVFGVTAFDPFSRTSVWRRAREAWTEAGLPLPTLHTGRHATVSRFIAAGVNVKAVQVYAGHSSAKTTMDVYGHLFPSTIDDDRQRLDEHLSRASRAPVARQSTPETTG